MTQQPIFRNTHEALVFAYQYSAQQYAESPMAKMMKRSGGELGSGRGLVGLDGAAQAGFVMAEVERLSSIQRACIIVKYARRSEPCKCCGGERPTPAFQLAIEALTAWAVPAGISHMRVRRALVQKWARAGKVEFKELASEYGMNRKTIGEQFQVLKKRLDDVDQQAQCAIDDALRQCGMVGDVDRALP
jgi:hypothetical protein